MKKKHGKVDRTPREPFPDLTAKSNEEVLDIYTGSSNWYDWTTTEKESVYQEELNKRAREEVLKRMS